jgi:hypothetical protein
VEERSVQFGAVKHLISGSLAELATGRRHDLDLRMTQVEEAGIVGAAKKCKHLREAEERAYFNEVPSLVKRLLGPARMVMQSSHEAFDVENTKVRAREHRLGQKLDQFYAATEHRFQLECEDRMRQFHVASEQLSSQLLLPVRLDRQHQRTVVMEGVRSVKVALHSEESARREGDGFVLSSLSTATQRLQATVMDNFGSLDETDSSEDGEASESDSD